MGLSDGGIERSRSAQVNVFTPTALLRQRLALLGGLRKSAP